MQSVLPWYVYEQSPDKILFPRFFSFELSDDHHRIPSFIGCHQLFTQKLLQEKIVWSELQTDFKS